MWGILSLVLLVGFAQGRVRLDPLAQTAQGLIRGQRADDGDYHMFLGIPYGQVNETNPFGIATAYPAFGQVFEASEDSALCPQIQDFTNEAVGTLDCLRLNIYVPTKANSRNRLPVLVWLHGGSYNTGHTGRYFYGPKYLVQHDVIAVTLNYRLGPYGFMCLGTPEVPGNQGLKDQLLALRWIKANIASFGGDVNRITLMGESAGSSSVELHVLSKQEKLYNNLIFQSGTTLKPGGVQETDITPALQIAEKLGFATEDVNEAVAFLARVDPALVTGAASQLSLRLRACVEIEFDNVESIITKHPLNLDMPKIKGTPVLVGLTDREGLLPDANQANDYFASSSYFRKNLDLVFHIDEDFQQYEDIVRRYYAGDEELTEEVRSNFIDFESDFHYNYPVQWSLRKYVESGAGDVYHYVFSYDGGRNFMKNRLNISISGAAHADDLGYLFVMANDETTPTAEDQLIIDRMTTLWTNFVKYGNPTPETTELLPEKWVPVTEDVYHCLNIDLDLKMQRRPVNDRLAFWELFYAANEGRLKGYDQN